MRFLDRLKARLAGRTPSRSAFTTIKSDGGGVVVMDPRTVEYLRSTAPDPAQAALDEVLDAATRVKVIDGGTSNGKPIGKQVLLDTREPGDLAAVRRGLRISEDPHTFGHCMCLGDLAIQLYAGRRRLATLGFHHGRSIRWDPAWKHDALLLDGQVMLDWLAGQGITGPKEAFAEAQRRAEQARRDLDRWLAAMPAGLEPFWEQMIDNSFAGLPATAMQAALERQFPDRDGQVLALLHWFGSGAGPWSGFPSYEMAAERLLLLAPTGDIVSALESPEVTSTHLEGAARYFAGWHFNKEKGADRGQLPAALKKKLLAHSLKTDDQDKRHRARNAF